MKIINTSSWVDFPLSELGFENYHGERLNKAQRVSGHIPFITAGKVNRGIAQYIETDRLLYHKAITVDMFGNCFFQRDDCTGDDNVYFFVNNELSDEQKLFISCVINVDTSRRFAYKEQFRQSNADSLTATLPVNSAGQPDWDYMQSMMEKHIANEESRITPLLAINSIHPRKINISGWHEFRLDELFTIIKGSRLKSTDRIPGEIPYVGASRFNNGITQYISNDEHLHPGGVLTVCYNGPVGTAFYQPIQFWATDDVNVLYPATPMSMEILLFVAAAIEKVGANYAYTDKWKIDDMAASKIPLPTTSSGTPDFDFITNHMRTLICTQESSLRTLQDIIHLSQAGCA